MYAIRRATEEDAGSIAHVHVESWRTTYKGIVPDNYLADLDETARTTDWRTWIGSEIPIFIAIQDGVIVGFIAGGPIRDPVDGYDAELYTFYLLQQSQRQGRGTALLRRLAGELRDTGFKSLAVWALEENLFSGFYLRSGALRLTSKEVEIGGALLQDIAYGWANLEAILSTS